VTNVDGERLLLLGCVKSKLPHPAAAKDLYSSDLWYKRRSYAEASGQPWRILSAEHGLLTPDAVIEPYDRHLASQPASYQERWSQSVVSSVLEVLGEFGLSAVQFHASTPYVARVRPLLEKAGVSVSWPFEGYRIGEHLAWYNRQIGLATNNPTPEPPAEMAVSTEWPVILSLHQIGPFEYRWPDATENFASGWEGTAQWGGREWRFRHGVGERLVYGRHRVHTVTWLEGQPVVEGVAADDYESSRSLLSRVKLPSGEMARLPTEVPSAYRTFEVVNHREEIDAPHSPRGLAVKIEVHHIAAWVAHALYKRSAKLTPRPKTVKSPPVIEESAEPEPAAVTSLEPLSMEHKQEVAKVLLEHGRAVSSTFVADGLPQFTSIPAANRLLVDDPFAFLLAVISDYQVQAEKAWSLPYLLKERLGHLEPSVLLAYPRSLAAAIARKPALHRYVNMVPHFILEACRIILDEYDGDAGAIWGDEPTAVELQRRLRRFPGISQKKAAMAVEILERDLGVPVRDLEGTDIAFDVHLRRVFLRSGMAEEDNPDHMIGIARQVHPPRPGALDFPAWAIGRQWCRPTDPLCGECVLDPVCAHRIAAAGSVRGA
jgi:uncharacterized HhH-GPD family protein